MRKINKCLLSITTIMLGAAELEAASAAPEVDLPEVQVVPEAQAVPEAQQVSQTITQMTSIIVGQRLWNSTTIRRTPRTAPGQSKALEG